jgi:tetratricopeptide (TPR) repeat protein
MDYLSLCLTCKDENDYLSEWLDYHILVGVERFYIYDNESLVPLRDTLKDYIKKGWVIIEEFPGKAVQLPSYDHCLQAYGQQTRWLGFIDTDEFLVPKTTLDLKELLKEFEPYGGLAVSSLFFGSNGFKDRPQTGQLANYTRRTHPTFSDNILVKSIVQPERALMPNSPHDFTYIDGSWCVNEAHHRVDYQSFPNYTEKIQLNHYFCRSESEIDQKLARSNSGAIAWSRRRFETVNAQSTYPDTVALHILDSICEQAGAKTGLPGGAPRSDNLIEKMAAFVQLRTPPPREPLKPAAVLDRRDVFEAHRAADEQIRAANTRKDYREAKRIILFCLESLPNKVTLYRDLAICSLNLNDPAPAWQALNKAWHLAPNSYYVLEGLVRYFGWTKQFELAEKTCHLLLNIAPHNLTTLAFLTEALLGQGRFEEALKIGEPVIELSAELRELPEGMGALLVKKLASYLQEKKEYSKAAELWEAGLKCQPGDVNMMLDWIRALLLAGNLPRAGQLLFQIQDLAPQNKEVQQLQDLVAAASSTRHFPGEVVGTKIHPPDGRRKHAKNGK